MPLLRNKFQPYFPDPDSPNRYQCGNEKYCWPVQIGDRILTQFYQTPCNNNEVTDPEFDDFTTDPDIIVNGDFVGSATGWTLGAGWTWVAGDRVQHTTTFIATLDQVGSGFTQCQFYRIGIDLTRTAGEVRIVLGTGVNAVYSDWFDTTGVYTFEAFYLDGLNDQISIEPSSTFDGYINEVTAIPINFTYWNPNCSWFLQDGKACWRDGGTSSLDELVPNYINAGGYYKVEIFVENLISVISMQISDVSVFLSNGQNTFYVNPTINGVLVIDAPSDQSDTVCISNPKVYALKNDYKLDLVDSDGTAFDVSNSIVYYNEFVTIDLDINDYELADDCYTLKIYDYCLVTSDNLVLNGDFVDGYTNWTRNNGNVQYQIVGDQLTFKFSPFTQGFTDYVTNGDFTSGAAWTLNAGWTIAGQKAVHTPGNTGTLFQTMTLPAPPLPATSYTYYVKFTVTNWTTGTVNLKLGNAVNGTTYTWAGNDTFLQKYNPQQSGSVDLIFTPSSTFDGEIDDVACVRTSAYSDFPIITNAANQLVTPGTYQTEWEIVGSSDPNISVRFNLLSGVPSTNYESAVAVHSYTQSYALNGGAVQGVANFQKTSNNYIQTNIVEGDITVDNISLVKVEPFEATFTSECIKYSSSEIPRTKMIIGYCDQNALGFDFENTGFKLMHRAEIRSLNPNYPSTSQIMKTGRGNDRFVYGELQKYWQVTTDFASETFHDLMAAILVCDHFEIGDTEGVTTEYSPSGEEYAPEWNGEGAYSLASASFQVRVKEKGQVFNRHI